jgi:pyruvate dehydrogenase E2 component (dihydrolipoamide acetyltransferase)
MAKLLEMPKLSPTMEEGQISAWHKKEGDEVAVDDLLAEVETDKATMEFRSFDKGTLLKILVPAGSVVKLGDPVAVLGKKGEDISSLVPGGAGEKKEAPKENAEAPQKSAEAPEEKPKDAPAESKDAPKEQKPAPAEPKSVPKEPKDAPAEPKDAPKEQKPTPKEQAPAPKPAEGERVKASPYVRKVAHERGVDLHGVQGSGPNGRIIARDLDGAKSGGGAAAKPGELAAPESRPLSMMRKAIARRLTESKQTVPHFYLTIDVDADPLHALREQINGDLASSVKKGEEAPKVSFNDLIIKACAIGLVRVPECNAQFTSDAILIHRRVDISVAVAVPDGLITPVVRDADMKSVLEISAEVKDLATRAKAKKLKPEEMTNGTFSISNLGMFGIDSFSAVINPPEGAILAVGQVREEPVVKNGQVVAGRRLSMTLSCDHRVVDGAIGATFLKALRQIVEHPTQILL